MSNFFYLVLIKTREIKMNKKPQLIIYDKETQTESVRTYDSHSECFGDFTALKSLGIEVRVVIK